MIKAFVFDLNSIRKEDNEYFLNLVNEAKDANVLVAFVSNKKKDETKKELEDEKLSLDSFDVVLFEEDVKRAKPYPDTYSLIFIGLGIDRKEALIFVDDAVSLKAAVSSHSNVCALTAFINRDEAKHLGANVLLENLSFFPEFNSLDELQDVFRHLRRIGKGAKKYGANWITPLERTLPSEVVEKKAIEEAKKAMYNAYAPYSKFKVGAAIVSSASGRIYSGCNVENASYGATICAERNAITTAITNEGAIGIDLVVVSSMVSPPALPCAVCLQVMSEFIRPETPVVLVSEDGDTIRYHYSDLLPHPFDFGEQ